MSRINSVLEKIGISKESELFFDFHDKSWKGKIPFRFQKGLDEINPNSFLLHNNKIIVLFFDFTQNDNVNLAVLFKKIWNLGGIPAIFIINKTTVDIYNGFTFDPNTTVFNIFTIGNTKLTEDNLADNFSLWDIFSGKCFKNLPMSKSQVDEKLLDNLESTKNLLVKNNLSDIYAQNIIGRLLFSRYLLDRKVKIEHKYFYDRNSFLGLIKNKSLLYEYFDYLKETFNGDLFPVTVKEKDEINDTHLTYLFELFSGSDIQEDGIQKSLFDLYDFNIIPIELISEVYERFMGLVKQKSQAAYYTPSFLVDYIIAKTVKPHLRKSKTCRILDPSCGSGIFLVESLRNIIEVNLDKNGNIKEEKLREIITENIFGVDTDENAINLTIFSLCLTLLDYIEPKDITKFQFPNLKNKNLFMADFFNLNHLFNDKINNLDYILGNPPWGSDKENNNFHIQYYKNNKIPISDKQIAQSFVARTKDFSISKTQCVMVLPSKPFLYNYKAKNYRTYLLNNFIIKEVLELSPVRHQLFSRADAPTSIIFFSYANGVETGNNIVTHYSIRPNVFLKYLKLIVIEKNDIKQIKQHYFKEYNWLWKTMLYGNIFDFYLMKRIKKDYETVNSIIDKYELRVGEGFIRGTKKKYSPDELFNKLYLDAKKEAVTRFFINENGLQNYEDNTFVERIRDPELFKGPYVLLKKSFNKKNFSPISVYSEKDFVFTDYLTAIKGKKNDKNILKIITGNLNSLFFSYCFLLFGSSAGVEREQGNNEKDRFEIPISTNNAICTQVDIIQNMYKELYSEIIDSASVKERIFSEEQKLNEIILNEFELTKTEKTLIDYAIEITIPQINNSEDPISKTTNDQLEQYAKIFIDHFSNRWNGHSDYFEIDIFYNRYVVGMNFKVVKSKPNRQINIKPDTNIKELFQLIDIGTEKITDTFYIQRDVRGFNENSFYVVKPNQYKNWHSAVAHGDLAEFIDAMLTAEKEILMAENNL